jgi:hypothetical protein
MTSISVRNYSTVRNAVSDIRQSIGLLWAWYSTHYWKGNRGGHLQLLHSVVIHSLWLQDTWTKDFSSTCHIANSTLDMPYEYFGSRAMSNGFKQRFLLLI